MTLSPYGEGVAREHHEGAIICKAYLCQVQNYQEKRRCEGDL